jgi:hypothetical protein
VIFREFLPVSWPVIGNSSYEYYVIICQSIIKTFISLFYVIVYTVIQLQIEAKSINNTVKSKVEYEINCTIYHIIINTCYCPCYKMSAGEGTVLNIVKHDTAF